MVGLFLKFRVQMIIHSFRMWYFWKGPTPAESIVAFMNKTYPPDWTYADFAAQFRAEFYGTQKSY